MENKHSNIMLVPGAALYYEVFGSGPMLLLIHDAASAGHAFDSLVRQLSDHYTVISYDRRGFGHSRLDSLQDKPGIEQHSDDAHRLLAELGTDYEPAYVFGSGDGAIIALDLVARHPEQVYTLVAHEPTPPLLPEADPTHRYQLDLAALARASQQAHIVLTSRSECEDQPCRNAAAIADQLGTDFVVFPSATTHPREFAQQLYRILLEANSSVTR